MPAPRLLLLDEPTRGVDVEAKSQIYAIIRKLAAEGKSIIFVSSEIEELPKVCDRVLVLREGRIAQIFTAPHIDVDELMTASIGGHAHRNWSQRDTGYRPSAKACTAPGFPAHERDRPAARHPGCSTSRSRSTRSNFLTFRNQVTILRDAAAFGIAAWGATLIIIAGEIDISVGPMVAFLSVVFAFLLKSGEMPMVAGLRC